MPAQAFVLDDGEENLLCNFFSEELYTDKDKADLENYAEACTILFAAFQHPQLHASDSHMKKGINLRTAIFKHTSRLAESSFGNTKDIIKDMEYYSRRTREDSESIHAIDVVKVLKRPELVHYTINDFTTIANKTESIIADIGKRMKTESGAGPMSAIYDNIPMFKGEYAQNILLPYDNCFFEVYTNFHHLCGYERMGLLIQMVDMENTSDNFLLAREVQQEFDVHFLQNETIPRFCFVINAMMVSKEEKRWVLFEAVFYVYPDFPITFSVRPCNSIYEALLKMDTSFFRSHEQLLVGMDGIRHVLLTSNIIMQLINTRDTEYIPTVRVKSNAVHTSAPDNVRTLIKKIEPFAPRKKYVNPAGPQVPQPKDPYTNPDSMRGKTGRRHFARYDGKDGRGLLFGKYHWSGYKGPKDPDNPKKVIVSTDITMDKQFHGKSLLRDEVIRILKTGDYHAAVAAVQDFKPECKLKHAREFVNKVKFKFNATHKRMQI
jgi:hypothetical protein